MFSLERQRPCSLETFPECDRSPSPIGAGNSPVHAYIGLVRNWTMSSFLLHASMCKSDGKISTDTIWALYTVQADDD